MRHRLRVAALAAGGVAAAASAAAALGALRWDRETGRAFARLEAGERDGSDAAAEPVQADGAAALPAPVARFLAAAIPPDRAAVTSASVEWEGEFRMRPDGRWLPFSARQRFTVRPPGFVWDAAIRMMPLVTVRVRDSYLRGEGAMRGSLASLVPVVDVHGTPEMAAGALARYLGEVVWLPTALAPREDLAWTKVDDTTARATLRDGSVQVSVDFHFGPEGEVVGVSGERFRDVDGRGVLTPWRARLRDHGRVDGMLVPRSGEVEWVLPEGPFAYWRGRLVGVEYDVAR